MRPRTILLGCVKQKRASVSPARDLYRSPLWRGRRRYAEASGDPWLILSAKHGVVAPDDPLSPYDLALADLSARERRLWGAQVVHELERRLGGLEGKHLEVHAGEHYRAAIADGLERSGASLNAPLQGLRLGHQLRWYKSQATADAAS